MSFPKAVFVKATEKYKIFIRYDDGTEGEVDLSGLAHKGVFEYWEQDNNFFKVHINPEGGGITWSSFLDICPDNVWLTLKGLTFDEWRALNKKHAASI